MQIKAALTTKELIDKKNYCQIYELGIVDYKDALNLQRYLAHERLSNSVVDTLILLEHPAVVTIGKSGKDENLLVDEEILMRQGISLFYIDRGGDITVHSPGQLVGYPILKLYDGILDPRAYIDLLEETIIRTLSHLYIKAYRVPGFRGIWADGAKICSIGVKVSSYVTSHGFALNVNNDLRYFSLINPCGIKSLEMTSISKVLARNVNIDEIIPLLIKEFVSVFHFNSYYYCVE